MRVELRTGGVLSDELWTGGLCTGGFRGLKKSWTGEPPMGDEGGWGLWMGEVWMGEVWMGEAWTEVAWTGLPVVDLL